MIEILKKYYELDIKEYQPYKEGIIFHINGYYYYLTTCYYNETQLSNILFLINNIRTIALHEFIYNKDNKLITEKYILMRLKTLITDITITDIRVFNSISLNEYQSKYIYMDELWEQKIDYLEHQISELSKNKLINNSFDYFIGLSETILKFFRNNYKKDKINLVLSHHSLNSLNTIDFYNPLELSYDSSLKDIASFIRLRKDEPLLLNIIDKLSYNDKCYLFVRMTFPFFYFNEVENILINEKDEDNLVTIINNIYKYEIYLHKMEKYFGFKLFYWIKKE